MNPRPKEALVTHDRLIALFSYDATLGRLRWKVSKRQGLTGVVAGDINGGTGYRRVKVDYRAYSEHRLIWFFHNGRWPDHQLDHINGIRNDNRIENLREATRLQNAQNLRLPQKNGRSGYLGVAWRGSLQKWRALIQVNGKRKELGAFDDPKEAHAAYVKAKRELHPYGTL